MSKSGDPSPSSPKKTSANKKASESKEKIAARPAADIQHRIPGLDIPVHHTGGEKKLLPVYLQPLPLQCRVCIVMGLYLLDLLFTHAVSLPQRI